MNLLIVGGSDAGISAAIRATELDPAVLPTVIVGDNFPNFSICGLPYYISHEVADWRSLAHRTARDIEASGINLVLGQGVTSIDTGPKQVTIADESGTTSRLEYDKLVMATGALSLRPRMDGLDSPGVFLLRTLPDSFAMEEFLKQKAPKKAVVVGGGYIGMEMCEALTTRGIKVTVVEYTESVMTSIDADFSRRIKGTLTERGVAVYTGMGVESIQAKGDELLVHANNGFTVPADMVLVAVGAVPNTALGRSIGVETGVKGAFKVNRRMETNIPDVYAAGDCAETWHKILQKNTYMPLGTVAHKQGRIAGENALGGKVEFAGTLGTQSVKIFDKVIARTGLNEKEARDAGFQPVTATSETWDHKVYYLPVHRLHIRVTADGETKRLLGAQMIGAYGTEVSKRIDIFAAALYNGATVDEFLAYDLSYTPPLSSPWDPVQMAVQKLERVLSAPASRR
ncbi:MAG: FAD-dependent oxidoreductase [Syntrophorhabdales bacterium]|jgi:NADPH-dependent 2,4-dienoyl-CoA reductase/sulfur reductase-like enzyme